MGRLNGNFIEESVTVRLLGAGDGSTAAVAAAEVLKLREPWIADEGPLTAELWQLDGNDLPRPLAMRGLAFDDRTTVQWDEDVVQVIEPADAEHGVIARRSEVLVRDRFPALASVRRTDYLRAGVLIASRYVSGPAKGSAADA